MQLAILDELILDQAACCRFSHRLIAARSIRSALSAGRRGTAAPTRVMPDWPVAISAADLVIYPGERPPAAQAASTCQQPGRPWSWR
jgi:hypothetical protein